MEKLIVTMPDNSQWEVPCSVIAEDRACYYSEEDNTPYDEVYEETMTDSYFLIDWAENNMNWSYIKQYAKMVRTPNVDYEDGWCNGYKRIVES